VLGGMVMLALLALQSAWQAWRVPMETPSYAPDVVQAPHC
jgi:hypothetical protein